jgi:hypothetical protein
VFIVHAGLREALFAGLLAEEPDIRAKLVMSGTTANEQPDVVHIQGFTSLDEYDGLGYDEVDIADVEVHHFEDISVIRGQIPALEFGTEVAPGSRMAEGVLFYLYVDGLADYALGFTDDGGFPRAGADGRFEYVLDPDGFIVAS